jgi:hypothetical protein
MARAMTAGTGSAGLELWHATVVPELVDVDVPPVFRPLTHFGSRRAALQRVGNVIDKRGWQYRPGMYARDGIGAFPFRIYPVVLDVRFPLVVSDAREERHGAGSLAATLARRRVIREADLVAVREAWGPGFAVPPPDEVIAANEARAASELARILRREGFDGLVYRNACEDVGANSWVILDPLQVTPAGPSEAMTFGGALEELAIPEDLAASPPAGVPGR